MTGRAAAVHRQKSGKSGCSAAGPAEVEADNETSGLASSVLSGAVSGSSTLLRQTFGTVREDVFEVGQKVAPADPKCGRSRVGK